MVSFNIFKRKKGIYWTNTLIVYSIIVPCMIFFLIRLEMGVEQNMFDAFLICSVVGSFVYGLIVSFAGFVRYEPIKGKLEGFLILDLDKILIDSQVYNLDDIQKIKIFSFDYRGRINSRSRGSFESILSQGVENEIILTLNSGNKVKCSFQQLNENEISKVRKELINYHLKGKIHFLHLIDILGITDYNQIQLFKKEIQWFQEDKLKLQ